MDMKFAAETFGWVWDQNDSCWRNKAGDRLLYAADATEELLAELVSLAQELDGYRNDTAGWEKHDHD
jgi:hypothetical protein